jgi:ferredoxin
MFSTKSNQSILEALESSGIKPESHCRNGFCDMCRCKVNPEDIKNIAIIREPLDIMKRTLKSSPVYHN